ncbi:MAG: hypothetical protein JEZ00_19455 [Anaerolineaceae bacterium]|nr:hypothetical protein [Anaerolineaceae bacterium]
MKLSAPKQWVFWVSVILAALAIISTFVAIPVISANAFLVLAIGFVLLALGNALKGF